MPSVKQTDSRCPFHVLRGKVWTVLELSVTEPPIDYNKNESLGIQVISSCRTVALGGYNGVYVQPIFLRELTVLQSSLNRSSVLSYVS